MRFWLGFGVECLLWVGGIVGHTVDYVDYTVASRKDRA
jgi:hypothetical protein